MASDSRFKVSLDVAPGGRSEPLTEAREAPLTIVVLGDFHGVAAGAPAGADANAIGSPLRVDADSLDRVLARYRPALHMELNGSWADVTFEELADFHPDRLLERVPPLAALRSARARAERSSEPLDVLRRAAGLSARSASVPAAPPLQPKPLRPPSGSVLDWILEAAPAQPAAPSDLERFVSDVVAPHLVPEPDASREALLTEMDAATTATLRSLLHDPGFQALEALWRGVGLLLQRLETGPALQVHLLQATRDALLEDFRAGGVARSQAARGLRSLPAQVGPVVVVADLFFQADDEDLDLLGALAELASSHGALLLSGAAPSLAGVGPAEPEGPWDVHPWKDERWLALRASAGSAAVGLALPRILLRPGYGQAADPIEEMAFEEMSAPPDKSRLLWGNPAFALALLVAEAHATNGHPLRMDELEVAGLPVHAWRSANDTGLVPCTEWTIRGDTASALRETGSMVFVPASHGDGARLLGFRTLGPR